MIADNVEMWFEKSQTPVLQSGIQKGGFGAMRP